MRHFPTLSIALFTTALLIGCAKDGDTGPAGAPGPSLSGDLLGFVQLFDQYGAHVLVDLDSANVSIDGTSMTSWSDSLGKYTVSGLHTGTYDVTCTKSGYGTMKVNSLQFVGGGDLQRDLRMAAIPTFMLDSISVNSAPGGLVVNGFAPVETQPRTVLVFVGTGAGTSADPATYLTFYNKNIAVNQNNFNIQIPASDFAAMGLSSGSTVYFAAYAATPNFQNTSSYEDPATGRTVFTAIGASAYTASALVP